MSFENRIIAITGAANGIGKALAEHFISRGAKLALSDIDTEGLARWKENPNVHTQRVDVGEAADVEQWYTNICAHFGGCAIWLAALSVHRFPTNTEATCADACRKSNRARQHATCNPQFRIKG